MANGQNRVIVFVYQRINVFDVFVENEFAIRTEFPRIVRRSNKVEDYLQWFVQDHYGNLISSIGNHFNSGGWQLRTQQFSACHIAPRSKWFIARHRHQQWLIWVRAGRFDRWHEFQMAQTVRFVPFLDSESHEFSHLDRKLPRICGDSSFHINSVRICLSTDCISASLTLNRVSAEYPRPCWRIHLAAALTFASRSKV